MQKSIKKSICLLLLMSQLLLVNALNAATLPTVIDDYPAAFRTTVDGPYVFYKGEQIIVKNFMISENLCEGTEETYAADDYVSLYCKIDPAGKIGFKFPLRKKHKPTPSVYPETDKLFAISDIEGNFSAFATTLKANGIINDRFGWDFGDGHLVLVGDFFDRGEHVTACLWLIYKLEEEAKRAGGQVHFIIGNHEEMNMRGDDRFVVSKYKRVAAKMEIPVRDLYEKDTELGRWLRTKNVVEKIGNTLFTHGGISPEFSKNGLSLEKVNQIAQQFMGESFRLIELQSNNDITPMVFAKNGPLWYRGYFKNAISEEEMKAVLEVYGAEHVVVGHTIVDEIETLYNGKLIPIDVKHAAKMKTNGFNAILKIGPDKAYKVNPKGEQEALVLKAPEPEPEPVPEEAAFVDVEEGPVVVPVNQGDKVKVENPETSVVGAPEKLPDDMPVNTTASNVKVTQVLKAIDEGNLIVLKAYLYDHDIDKPVEGETFTLVHFAIGRGKLDIVKFLMEEDADPDVLYSDKTALMYALKRNDVPIIKYLVDLGVSVKVENLKKQSALHYAAKYSTPDIARLLLENGASPRDRDGRGLTALQTAEQYKNIPVANFLKTL